PRRDGLVVHLVDDLHLHEVVAGAERAELAHAALDGLARDGLGVGAGNGAGGLDGLEILARAVAAPDRPPRAVRHHAAELARVEADRAAPADAGGHRRVERLDARAHPRRDRGRLQARSPDAPAAVAVD